MNCPNCGTSLPEGALFCPVCGTRIEAKPSTAPTAPAPEESYTPPAWAAPAPSAPAASAASASPSRGKAITSVILGPGGLGFSALGLIFSIIGLESVISLGWINGVSRYWNGPQFVSGAALTDFVLGWVFALVGVGLSIPGLILGAKAMRDPSGTTRNMGRAGKITGLIGVILGGVVFLFAMVMFIIYLTI